MAWLRQLRRAVFGPREDVLLSSIVRSATPMLLVPLDGRAAVRPNPAFCRLIGVEPASAQAPGLAANCGLLDALERAGHWTLLARARTLGGVEVEFFAGGGALIVAWVAGDVLELAGRACAVLTVQDVSDRARRERALRECESRFDQLAENLREIFWLFDPGKGEVLYVSPTYEGVWGRTSAALRAAPLGWLEAIHAEDRPRVAAAFARLPRSTGFEDCYRILRPDGEVRWVRHRGIPLRDAAGAVHRIVNVAEDITSHKHLEAQVVHAQRLEAVGRLASGVAHDLNNLLTPILMAAGALRTGLESSSGMDLPAIIETSASRGADIVRRLLAFGRGVQGARGPFLPAPVLRELRALVVETFPRNVATRIAAPSDLWPIEADPTQVHQVLLNLCVNARDAMRGGGTLFLGASNETLAAEDARLERGAVPGPYVVFTVSDTGEGIPPDVLPRIFDPFFTTKSEGEGSGLGLSTVRTIVQGHGGFIAVRTEVGRGTTFRVYLPAAAGQPVVATEPVRPAPRGAGELILVVDDERAVRTTAQACLKAQGYRVLLASDGAVALGLYLRYADDIALVVTDLMMPTMDGRRFAWELRAIGATVPILASSGMSNESTNGEADYQLFSGFLPKPYDARGLLVAVAAQLHRDANADVA